MRFVSPALTLFLAACGPFPRDIEGTSEAVRERGTIHVGLTAMRPPDRPLASAYVERLERATGARAAIDSGPAELQLSRLEQGALDVVLGEFAADSPWVDHVAVIEPLVERTAGKRAVGLSPVAANGENAWIALLEREVRDMREARE